MTSSFDDIQDKLGSLGQHNTPMIDRLTSGFFGMKNPFSRKAVASEHEVWLRESPPKAVLGLPDRRCLYSETTSRCHQICGLPNTDPEY